MFQELIHILETQEKLLKAKFCFHNPTGSFIKMIPERYYNHQHSFCVVVKTNQLARCIRFDGELCQQKSFIRPEGFWKTCHANATEYYIPLINPKSKIREGSLFIGLFQPIAETQSMLLAPQKEQNFNYKQTLPILTSEWMLSIQHSAILIKTYIETKILTEKTSIYSIHERKEQIIYFLREQLKRTVTLEDLAAFLNVSYSRAGQILKEKFNLTFPALLTRLRLEKSTDLLTNSPMPIHQIAQECGYQDTEYFHKVFKRKYQLTPMKYRLKNAEITLTDI